MPIACATAGHSLPLRASGGPVDTASEGNDPGNVHRVPLPRRSGKDGALQFRSTFMAHFASCPNNFTTGTLSPSTMYGTIVVARNG